MNKKRTTERTKDGTPRLVFDGDTGELYTPLGLLKKRWKSPELRKDDVRDKTGGTWDDPDAPECWS